MASVFLSFISKHFFLPMGKGRRKKIKVLFFGGQATKREGGGGKGLATQKKVLSLNKSPQKNVATKLERGGG